MRSPFPAMAPYLENPRVWPGVHHLLIVEVARLLSPQLRPKYRVALEVRTYEASNNDKSLLVAISQEETASPVAVLSPPAVQAATVTLPMLERVKEGYLEIRDVATKEVVTAIEILSPTNKKSGEGRKAYLTKRERVLATKTHLVEIYSRG